MPFQDLREFLALLEKEGELKRIKAQVDWNLEIGAITRRGIELKLPAILFENIKDYPSRSVLGNIMSGTKPVIQGRLALGLGLAKDTPVGAIIDDFASRIKKRLKPRIVKTGPCKENILKGDDVNLLQFPACYVHNQDGGRYLCTWHIDVCRDPDTGWTNWGMYRHMIQDEKTLGWLAPPAQHGPFIFYQKYEARGNPMPLAVAIGNDPVCEIVASTSVPAQVDEVDVIGGIRGEPVELVKCETVDLEVPANAEIVIEGYVAPYERMDEGDFGEFTGYAAGERLPRPVFHVTCVTHRNNPILPMSNTGKPWDESGVLRSVTYSAFLANELRERGVPFKAVYFPPPTMAVIVSVNPPYAGYLHTIASAIWANKAGILRPYIFVVGEDVDVTDMQEVLWCLTTRLHPERGIHIQKRAPAQVLAPFLWRQERVDNISARVAFDATFPKEWGESETPRIIDFEQAWPEEVKKKALNRWKEL